MTRVHMQVESKFFPALYGGPLIRSEAKKKMLLEWVAISVGITIHLEKQDVHRIKERKPNVVLPTKDVTNKCNNTKNPHLFRYLFYYSFTVSRRCWRTQSRLSQFSSTFYHSSSSLYWSRSKHRGISE